MIADKSVLAIIPARGGSKGVPRKNLRMVKGKSLLCSTIEAAKQSKFIDTIIVSSEDAEIIAAAKAAGASVPFVRPLDLAQDETTTSQVILHALLQMPHYDYILVLQATSPLRNSQDIDASLQLLIEKKSPACVSVSETAGHPYWMFMLSEDQALKQFIEQDMPKRRQDLPAAYALNGAIYAAETEWFKQHQRFISEETVAYVMPQERSLDIDTEFDFKLLETYLHHEG